jgi:hypothetical protein
MNKLLVLLLLCVASLAWAEGEKQSLCKAVAICRTDGLERGAGVVPVRQR